MSASSTQPRPHVPHHAECICEGCQVRGEGYFAQRAALAGDSSAVQRLSPRVYAFLMAERISKRMGRRRPTVAA